MTATQTPEKLTKKQLVDVMTEGLFMVAPPPKATKAQIIGMIADVVTHAAKRLGDRERPLHGDALAEAEKIMQVGYHYGFAEPPADDGTNPLDEPEEAEGEVVDEPTVAEVEDEVGKAIALREQVVAPVQALPTPAEFNAVDALATMLYQTTFVPEAYRGRQADVAAAIFFGREIGLGPMMALRDIYMIDGRPALAAHRQLAKLRQGGVTILESKLDEEGAWIKARRRDTGEVMEVDFTYADAEKIKRKGKVLVDGDNWRNYRKDMLWARAVGRLTRRLGPDLVGGLPPYVAEEVADFSGWGVDYDAQGSLGVQQKQGREPSTLPDVRKEYPDWNRPASWADLLERLGARVGEPDAKEWVRQAVAAVYPGDGSIMALNQQQRRQMFQRCTGALAAVEELPGDLMISKTLRQDVAQAFARFLDGTVVEGPAWRVQAEDGDRPTYDEWQLLEEADADEERQRLVDAMGVEGDY